MRRDPKPAFSKCFVKAAALFLLSLFVFNFQAQAGVEGAEIPGALAALSLPGDLPKNDISVMPLTQPTPTDALNGDPRSVMEKQNPDTHQ